MSDLTRLRLAVALEESLDCPSCLADDRHAHRTRRSPGTVAACHVPTRGLPRRSGAPSHRSFRFPAGRQIRCAHCDRRLGYFATRCGKGCSV